MTTSTVGSQADIASRLRQLLPFGWFPYGITPLDDGLLTGIAAGLSFIYSLLSYVRLQTRIASATDGFLDLIANDFFGDRLPRQANESDSAYRGRIQANMLRERATRRAITLVLEQLTGRQPIIVEPRQPMDTGAYNTAGTGYNEAGYYGTQKLPFQLFIIAFRPPQNGIPGVGGYGVSVGGYGIGRLEYVSLEMIDGVVTDATIYAAIESVRPVGTRFWVSIQN